MAPLEMETTSRPAIHVRSRRRARACHNRRRPHLKGGAARGEWKSDQIKPRAAGRVCRRNLRPDVTVGRLLCRCRRPSLPIWPLLRRRRGAKVGALSDSRAPLSGHLLSPGTGRPAGDKQSGPLMGHRGPDGADKQTPRDATAGEGPASSSGAKMIRGINQHANRPATVHLHGPCRSVWPGPSFGPSPVSVSATETVGRLTVGGRLEILIKRVSDLKPIGFRPSAVLAAPLRANKSPPGPGARRVPRAPGRTGAPFAERVAAGWSQSSGQCRDLYIYIYINRPSRQIEERRGHYPATGSPFSWQPGGRRRRLGRANGSGRPDGWTP